MVRSMPVLVAPDAFSATLRASVVAAAIGRGLERAGFGMPDLCPVSGGGRGTIEVLLPVLGGETGDGFALIEGGGTALVEVARAGTGTAPVELATSRGEDGGPAIAEADAARGWTAPVELATSRGEDGGPAIAEAGAAGIETGARIARAIDAGAEVVVVCAGAAGEFAAGPGARAVDAIEDRGGLRGAALVVLCETRAAWVAPAGASRARGTCDVRTAAAAAGRLPRDPRGVAMTAAGGGLAGALWATYDAHLVPGAAFVLDQLGFDARMRAARAVIVGEARLNRATLAGRVAGEAAIRARQAGVPCHAIVGANAVDAFDARILDLQAILEAGTIDELEAAGELLASLA